MFTAQEAEVNRLKALIINAMSSDIGRLAELLASKKDKQVFGPTELEVWHSSLQAVGKAMETVLEELKRPGTTTAA